MSLESRDPLSCDDGTQNKTSNQIIKYSDEDAAILAMCDADGGASSTPNEKLNPPPFTFGMEGSTINISHSTDIHFGPKTVSSSPRNSLNSCGSAMSRTGFPPTAGDDFLSHVSTVASLSTQFQEVNVRPSSTYDVSPRSSLDSTPEAVVVRSSSSVDGEINTGLISLRKSISNPVGVFRPTSPSPSYASTLLPEVHRQLPQMSASINNSSNVQMGTQIVYNYYISESDQLSSQSRTRVQSSQGSPVSASPGCANDFLLEFREKLISVYQKRTMSSPLPWHRGKHLIPINEYYTEPELIAIDKCGKRTTETVDIMSIINSNKETRFLVEGEAGMGKTSLATRLAEEWAKGRHLQQFEVLISVTLGDFKGSLQQYVREELLPSYFKKENFEKVWEYCKSHDKKVVFILDGYDELQKLDKGEIHNLLKCKDFPESKVVVTSRPNILEDWEKKILVSGFSQIQILEFIEKYFRAIGYISCGQSLIKILEKDDKYWKLAKRPLFCVLLCMLYMPGEERESLPDRQAEIMLQIILCLIKWNNKNNGNSSTDWVSLPQEYEKPFYHFGKLCLNALKSEKSRFSDQEVHGVEGFDTKLCQLGFLYNDNESHALGERKFWKPVHQIFLEYLGAFYMARHLKDCKSCKECKSYDSVFQRTPEVLKFCVGILNNKAYKMVDGQRFPVLYSLSVSKILHLLKEAEPKPENCQAIAKLLDQSTIEVSTSEIEFEGWSYLLSQSFRRLTTIKIAWRIKSKSPDQETAFTEASESHYSNFFEALKNNESIRCIHVRAKQDGEPFASDKIAMFFSHLQKAFFKKNLQELYIVEMKMKASGYLRAALENALNHPSKIKPLMDLRVLKLHTFMEDKDLMGICDVLQNCAPSLESLHLEGLEHGNLGFQSLVQLLKENSNIQYLYLSMNQSLFVNVFGSGSTSYPPVQMRSDHQRMNKTAGKISKQAFSTSSDGDTEEDSAEGEASKKLRKENHLSSSRDINPRKELSFLFEKLCANGDTWNLEARHHWYLRKASSDLRIALPICLEGEHKSVFHFLFSALPDTHVRSLILHQAGLYLTTPDLICLGNSVRKSPYLSIINLQGLDKIEGYLPLLIGIGQSPALTSVSLSSSKVILNDVSFEIICAALQNNTALRNLSLGRWQFHIRNVKEAIKNASALFGAWQVAHLDLTQCVIDIRDGSLSSSQPQSPKSPLAAFFLPSFNFSSSQPWRTIKTLSLEGLEAKEDSGLVYRGHLLLPGVTNFVNLTSLDLSVSEARRMQVDNMALRRFFGLIGNEMKQLTELKLDNWEFCFHPSKASDMTSSLRSCRRLKKIQLERVNEIVDDKPSNLQETLSTQPTFWCKLTFLHQLVSYLPGLEELSLCYYRINNQTIDQETAAKLGSCFHDHWHHTSFTVKFFNLSQEVDSILYETLKKPPCRVIKRSTGPSLMKCYEVKCIIGLMKRH